MFFELFAKGANSGRCHRGFILTHTFFQQPGSYSSLLENFAQNLRSLLTLFIFIEI